MDNSLPLIFRVFQIIIPTFAVIILCTGICKCFLQSRRRRQEQRQLREASARAQEPPMSVYVIPRSPPQEEQSDPRRYNLTPEYAPPPPYSELMVKPDYPHDPPPAYTESVSPEIISSNPDRVVPSCPTLPQ